MSTGPLTRICFSNSSKCSACIRPISRIVVLSPSAYFSIFKVIFDLSDDSRVHRENPSAIRKYLSCWSLASEGQATISAFAESSASLPEVGRAKLCRRRRIEKLPRLEGRKVPEGRKAMGDYEVLKRCRLIPSFLIFDS